MAADLIYGTMRLTNWGANMDAAQASAFLTKLVDMGVKIVDTADIYGDYSVERLLGEVFAANPGMREKLFVITKCGIKMVSPGRPEHKTKQYDASEAHILASVTNSLKEMKTGYLDQLLIHRPDPYTHPAETARAFAKLKEQGSVKSFGVSNYSPSQFEALHNECSKVGVTLDVNQVEISLFHPDCMFDGTLDQCMRLGVKVQAWSPVGGGKLWVKDSDEQTQRVKKALEEVGAAHGGATLEAVALAWVSQHPADISLIVGTTKVERVAAAAKFGEVKLTREQWFFLLQAARGHEVA